ncbi:MAG: FKBP-type peptidyl-prolyl cis-trans isomerase [Bacteroidales bacterium]|nr:FKBP-type peptidyl-prolyl cis-trans isomerase [Bacteroidales bacterium]
MDRKKMVLLMILLLLFVLVVFIISWSYAEKPYQVQTPEVNTPTDANQQTTFQTETLQQGDGSEEVKPGDRIAVNFIGTLKDGNLFDSNLDSGMPYEFTISKGEVIQGWDKGLIGMKVGEKRKLVVPPELGYGSEEKENIPKDSTLYYEVELVEIKG